MIEFPQTATRCGATVAQLDILELLRSGALSSYPLEEAPGRVHFPMAEADLPEFASEVEFTDLEGVPVARVPLVRDADGAPAASGEPMWLSSRSSRPFERWHSGPNEVSDHTGVVVVRHPVANAALDAAIAEAGARPLVLALASLDGDVSPRVLETARALQSAATRPGVRVAIAPVLPGFTTAEQDAVVASHAHGLQVIEAESAVTDSESDEAGVVLFLTGLSGSGKSTVAREVRNRLVEDGERVTLLDGDVVRRHLSAGLGFSRADRDTNIRRVGWVAAEITHHGGVAICSPIAPFAATRRAVQQMVESRGGRFVLVHIATPLAECERRDRKGLYAKARRGEIKEFTGISSPYEAPESPALRIDTTDRTVESVVEEILPHLVGAPNAQ